MANFNKMISDNYKFKANMRTNEQNKLVGQIKIKDNNYNDITVNNKNELKELISLLQGVEKFLK